MERDRRADSYFLNMLTGICSLWTFRTYKGIRGLQLRYVRDGCPTEVTCSLEIGAEICMPVEYKGLDASRPFEGRAGHHIGNALTESRFCSASLALLTAP